MSIVLSPMLQARRKCPYPYHARIATMTMMVSVPRNSTVQRARPRNRLRMISIRTCPPRRWVYAIEMNANTVIMNSMMST